MEPAAPRLPLLVAWLGYGGLLPFVALSAALVLRPSWAPLLTAPLLQYAGLILSFIGALHWGLALRLEPSPMRNWLFGWSVMPCLIAWLALQLPTPAAVLILLSGYALHAVFDRRLGVAAGAPLWYPRLRLQLTVGAMLALLLSLVRQL